MFASFILINLGSSETASRSTKSKKIYKYFRRILTKIACFRHKALTIKVCFLEFAAAKKNGR